MGNNTTHATPALRYPKTWDYYTECAHRCGDLAGTFEDYVTDTASEWYEGQDLSGVTFDDMAARVEADFAKCCNACGDERGLLEARNMTWCKSCLLAEIASLTAIAAGM